MKVTKRSAIYIFCAAICLCLAGCDIHSEGLDDREGNHGDTTGPGVVTVTGASAKSTMITVSWTNPSDADFDHVAVAWSVAGGEPHTADVGDGLAQYAIPDLIASTEYAITLTAVDASNNSSEDSAKFSVSTTDAGQKDHLFIYTVDDLNAVRGGDATHAGWDLAASYILMADLDLGVAPYDTGAGWTPIGDDTNQFAGSFDGNGHSISNLYINDTVAAYRGLFGCVQNASVAGLDLVDVNVRGGKYAGGLSGIAEYSVISGCSVAGTASSVAASDEFTGGLIGCIISTTVYGCYSNATVSGSGNSKGGIAGYDHNSPVSLCCAAGDVTGTGRYIGCLVGNNESGNISECCATGAVGGNGAASGDVGGLVGANRSSGVISNCYAKGNVTGSGDNVGGLAGGNYVGSTIEYSYAVGLITADFTTYKGGLVGYSGSDTTYTYCFYDSMTTTMTIFNQDYGVPMETSDMKDEETFTDLGDPWDFTSIWGIDDDGTINGGYPYLRENHR